MTISVNVYNGKFIIFFKVKLTPSARRQGVIIENTEY